MTKATAEGGNFSSRVMQYRAKGLVYLRKPWTHQVQRSLLQTHPESKADIHGASLHGKLSTKSKLINLSILYFTTHILSTRCSWNLWIYTTCIFQEGQDIVINPLLLSNYSLDLVFIHCPVKERNSCAFRPFSQQTMCRK